MGSCCWTEGVHGMEYNFRIVKTFRIFIGDGMVNDYRIVCIFGEWEVAVEYKVCMEWSIILG